MSSPNSRDQSLDNQPSRSEAIEVTPFPSPKSHGEFEVSTYILDAETERIIRKVVEATDSTVDVSDSPLARHYEEAIEKAFKANSRKRVQSETHNAHRDVQDGYEMPDDKARPYSSRQQSKAAQEQAQRATERHRRIQAQGQKPNNTVETAEKQSSDTDAEVSDSKKVG